MAGQSSDRQYMVGLTPQDFERLTPDDQSISFIVPMGSDDRMAIQTELNLPFDHCDNDLKHFKNTMITLYTHYPLIEREVFHNYCDVSNEYSLTTGWPEFALEHSIGLRDQILFELTLVGGLSGVCYLVTIVKADTDDIIQDISFIVQLKRDDLIQYAELEIPSDHAYLYLRQYQNKNITLYYVQPRKNTTVMLGYEELLDEYSLRYGWFEFVQDYELAENDQILFELESVGGSEGATYKITFIRAE